MKFYIATGLSNADNARKLSEMLVEAGHQPTYQWWIHGSVQDPKRSIEDQMGRLVEVASAEASGVRQANVVIVLLPGYRGTHTELGIAIGTGKEIIIHLPTGEELFDEHGRTCIFYHHPYAHLSVATSMGTLVDLVNDLV